MRCMYFYCMFNKLMLLSMMIMFILLAEIFNEYLASYKVNSMV